MNYLDNVKFVDALSNPETDYKVIAVEIAKRYPDIFVECISTNDLTDIEKEVLKILKRPIVNKQNFGASPLIEAIKYYRSATNKMLKESKDTVEAMRDRFINQGLLQNNP